MVDYKYCRRDIIDKWLLLIVQFIEFKNSIKCFSLVIAELFTGQVSVEAQQMTIAVTYHCHCFISSTHSRWSLQLHIPATVLSVLCTEDKCVDTISPLHKYCTASVECFTYLTFFTAVACSATPWTFPLCWSLTVYTLDNFQHRFHLDRKTKFLVTGRLHQWHPRNFNNTC
jgi:hypothetical protein